MPSLVRRKFLVSGALGLAGLAVPEWLRAALSGKAREKLKITDIEAHEICPPYHDYNARWLFRYHGLGVQLRTIYVVKTQSGLEGIGESWGPLPENDPSSRYVGSSAFDWIGDTRNLAINMAVYDLMGKYLGLPCWKLIGPRVRSWVPVAAWTASQPPEGMAEEAVNVAGRGFHWLKYHVDVFQNVVDQTEAIQKVAPPGFKVHYDFNADSNLEAVGPVLKELEKFSVAGRIEDPLRPLTMKATEFSGKRVPSPSSSTTVPPTPSCVTVCATALWPATLRWEWPPSWPAWPRPPIPPSCCSSAGEPSTRLFCRTRRRCSRWPSWIM